MLTQIGQDVTITSEHAKLINKTTQENPAPPEGTYIPIIYHTVLQHFDATVVLVKKEGLPFKCPAGHHLTDKITLLVAAALDIDRCIAENIPLHRYGHDYNDDELRLLRGNVVKTSNGNVDLIKDGLRYFTGGTRHDLVAVSPDS